ncbi:MAG: phosphate propanoyltransferase [Bacillota bacterium]
MLESKLKIEVPVGISNRHIHLSQQHLEALFGKGYELTKMKDTYQHGQFAANETLTLVGPKGIIENVRILGPIRKETQIEISMTDSYKLGIKAPVRDSGKLDGSPGCALIGPNGVVSLQRGVILAERHIHMSPAEAHAAGLQDNDRVVVLAGDVRELCFHHVLVRVHSSFSLEIHIDTDEANAAGLRNGDKVMIIGRESHRLEMVG